MLTFVTILDFNQPSVIAKAISVIIYLIMFRYERYKFETVTYHN